MSPAEVAVYPQVAAAIDWDRADSAVCQALKVRRQGQCGALCGGCALPPPLRLSTRPCLSRKSTECGPADAAAAGGAGWPPCRRQCLLLPLPPRRRRRCCARWPLAAAAAAPGCSTPASCRCCTA